MIRSELKRAGFARKLPTEAKPAKVKTRKCPNRECRKPFEGFGIGNACSIDCAHAVAMARLAKQKAKAARADRVATKARLLEMKPLTHFLRRAEHACNAYIRARDAGNGCISCGRHDADVWNAGHFISVGANSTLRYHEDNIHLQCARPCNKDKGGNLIEYRKALLVKIGAERMAFLEGWHAPIKRTRPEIEAIEVYYTEKLKQLKTGE